MSDITVSRSGSSVYYQYAGFWWRVWASLIDGIIVTLFGFIIGFIIGFTGGVWAAMNGIPQNQTSSITTIIGFLIGSLYHPVFESSSMMGSPGKRLFSLRVVDDHGDPIGFGRSLGRNLGKFVSSLIIGVGFLMAGWTRRKQALHDMMSGCLVVRQRRTREAVNIVER